MRLAILSDIHEDYESLLKIVAEAGARGYDKLICLGDISGFSPGYYRYEKSRNAPACLALLREKCDLIIAGNHDIHAAGRDPSLPAELTEQECWSHEEDLDPGYSEEELQFLKNLPFYEILPSPAGNIFFSHYLLPNINGFANGFYFKPGQYREHFDFMLQKNCRLGFSGHAHPAGISLAHPGGSRHYKKRNITISRFPALIGIPPATRN